MKRVISLLLCLVMCVSVFSATATQVYASDKTDAIFTVKKTDFVNDRITYTISLNENQKNIVGAVIKVKYDSAVLEVSSDSGAVGSVNDLGEFAANVTGYYEKGNVYNDKGTYAVAYMNPNGYSIGSSSKKFIKITFKAIGEERPKTDVRFYCAEFITDDGNDTNDIRKSDGTQRFYSHSFLTLNKAENHEVSSSGEGIKFTWTEASGAEWYNIYRKEAGGSWAKLAEVPAGTTEYVDKTIVKGIEYYYSVEAANQYGGTGYDTTGLAGFSFGTISEIKVKPTERGALVSWSALKGAESYSVYRNQNGAKDDDGNLIWKKVGETTDKTRYEDEPLTSGVKYSYTVKAHKGKYNAEAAVSPVELTFVANANIVGYKLNYNDIVINWTLVSNADRYWVYRKAAGETSYTKIGSSSDNSFTDTNVENKKTYSYQVRSVAENGDASVLGKTGYDIVKLPITTKVTATMGTAHITVSWNAAELAENYIIYRKTSTGNWGQLATVSATKTKYKDTSVESGKTYAYAVVSKTEKFTTELSVVSNSVYYIATPEAINVSIASGGIELKFKSVDGAEKYRIYRREVDGKFGSAIATITQSTLKQYKYLDKTALSGVQYIYGVRAVSGDVKTGITESSLACRLDEPEFKIKAAYGGIKLTWNKVRGAEKYAIYHSTSRKVEDLKPIATVTGTSFSHKGLESGRNNYYAVQAVCGDTKSAMTQDSIYYIAAPDDVQLKAFGNFIRLKWKDVLGADQYIVYRKVYGESEWEKIKVTTSYDDSGDTTYVIAKDSSALSGKKYVYTVVASDGEDYSAKYEKGWAITYLAAPTLKSVKNSYSGPKLTWGKVSGASKYYIYRRTKSTEWKYLASTISTSYVDKTAKSDTKYYYVVKSVKGSLSSYHSATYFNTVCKTVDYLAAPVVKVANNKTTSITVSWSKVSGAQKYYVYRKAGSATSWTRVKTTTSTSFTDKNVKNGTTYKYMVKAVDGTILSGYNTSGETIKRLAAPTPSSVTSSKSGITFKWGKVTGASGYIVYRKTGSGSYKQLATVKGSTKVSYFDKSAEKGKTYTYIVKAYSGSSKSASKTGLKIKDKY